MSKSNAKEDDLPIAVIPARGGSKRIPRKNIKHFLGKPIIAYPITEALASNVFSKVIVSTDDLEIAQIAKHYGASVPFIRSQINSTDNATIVDVLLEVLSNLGDSSDRVVCCIFPTSVFAKAEFLRISYDGFVTSGFDSSVCVTEYEHPIQRALSISSDPLGGRIEFCWPEYRQKMTNSLEKYYHDVGMLYWMRANALRQERNIFTSRTNGIIVDRKLSQDIDCEDDWVLAELKYKRILEENF